MVLKNDFDGVPRHFTPHGAGGWDSHHNSLRARTGAKKSI